MNQNHERTIKKSNDSFWRLIATGLAQKPAYLLILAIIMTIFGGSIGSAIAVGLEGGDKYCLSIAFILCIFCLGSAMYVVKIVEKRTASLHVPSPAFSSQDKTNINSGGIRSSQLDGANTSLGIVQSFRRRDGDYIKPLNQCIHTATSDILFIGLSLPKLDNSTGLLEEKARDGIHVRLLVPDSCEEWLVLAIARFLMREGPYPQELLWFFKNFLPVWQRVPSHLEVRVHNYLPSVSASMFDGKEGNIEIYMFGWKTDERFIFELDFDGVAKGCRSNLNMLWNKATPFNSEADFQKRISAAEKIAQKLASKPSSK